MARASTSSQRNLTLMEELEKLEQSITLTLQEIDHNFSRAHRIVTSSILPVVENYAKHSEDVWEGSKFWKQFFEASANVSLNSYEETPNEETITEETVTDEGTSQATPSSSSHASPQHHGFDTTPTSQRFADNEEGSTSVFSSPDTSSTPRASRSNKSRPSIATYASPYEALRREVQGKGSEDDTPTSTLPSTPRGQTLSESTAESSPFLPPSTARQTRTPANDLLLHRVLDKNYRLQATPHTQARLPKSSTYNSNLRTPGTARRAHGRNANELDSSPLEEAPQLREELFGSPAKAKRVPGISVLTPARKTAQKDYQEDHEEKAKAKATVWDSDSDDDDLPEGMSPPKTMQFHIPQSKLLKTPAREASKRIVEDLLLTAGGNITESDDDSPSVVKRSGMREEDTF